MDHEMFVRGIPRDKFEIVRDEYPVYWNEEEGVEPGFRRRCLGALLAALLTSVTLVQIHPRRSRVGL